MALHKVHLGSSAVPGSVLPARTQLTITGTVGITSDAAAGAVRIKPGSVLVNRHAIIYQGAATA